MSSTAGSVIYRYRGDTAADTITEKVRATNLPRDITGYTYLLTLNTLKNPPDDSTQVLQIAGVISDPTSGVVQFPWTALQADQPVATYWYDIERTDTSGRKMTIAKNKYIFRQDITKS
jgi:hypothetical protein